jgi:MFS family permease
LTAQFGWTMAQLQAGLAAMVVTMLVSGPWVGLAADHYGVRRVALISVPLLGLTIMAFSLMSGAIMQFYLLCVAVALCGVGATAIIWTRAVNRRFNRSRGLALGLTLSGTGLFALVAKPSIAAVIHSEGWRIAYVALGSVPLLVLPVVALCFRDAAPARAQTGPPRPASQIPDARPTGGLTIVQTLRHWRFWLLLFAFIPAAFATAGPMPNLERMFVLHGSDMSQAVMVTSLIGISIVVGRLGGGWLIDHFWAPGVGAVLLLLPAISCLILSQSTLSRLPDFLAVALLGLGAGAELDLLAYLVARYIGMYRYSSIYGFLFGLFTVVGGCAPAVFGVVVDRTGSYTPILLASSVGLVLGAAAMLCLGRYPDFGIPSHLDEAAVADVIPPATKVNAAAGGS